ncbi:hypothetical protein [Thermus caldilimi]|nr:hypothetical protein [Thermus caldilimi]
MVRPYRFSLEEFRGPAGDPYREQLWLSPGEKLAPLAFPNIPLEALW